MQLATWTEARRRNNSAPAPSPKSALRPNSWSRFIGHDDVKHLLLVAIKAAKLRGEQMGSVLLWGPPGCGKSSLGYLVGKEFASRVKFVNGSSLQAAKLVSIVLNNRRGTLIVDEIHCLPPNAQDLLLTVLDEGRMWWGGQSIPTPVSIVGTTTNLGDISSALRSRFRLEIWVGPYSPTEIALIANQAAAKMGVSLPLNAARIIAGCARGVPRSAIRLLHRYRDLSTIGNGGSPERLAQQATEDLGYDEFGLLPQERNYLFVLWNLGGRTGLANIASVLDLRTQETKLLESYLLKLGLVAIESRGRALTPAGLELFI